MGCKNKKTWCQDPRCAPYCPEERCTIPNDHDFNGSVIVLIILMCLLTILFIVWVAYGPQLVVRLDEI